MKIETNEKKRKLVKPSETKYQKMYRLVETDDSNSDSIGEIFILVFDETLCMLSNPEHTWTGKNALDKHGWRFEELEAGVKVTLTQE